MKHIERLKKFDAKIPSGEGLVFVEIYSDETFRYKLEVWGLILASADNGGAFEAFGDEWRDLAQPETDFVNSIIENLNRILA